MTRGAMTLLETLLSLAMLGLLMTASLGWITSSQRSLKDTAARTAWRRCAQTALALMHDDLRCGDTATWANTLRILPEPGPDTGDFESATFQTRSPITGPGQVTYRFDLQSGRFTRTVSDSERLLVGSLASASIEIINGETGSVGTPPQSILITLSSENGWAASRAMPLGPRKITP